MSCTSTYINITLERTLLKRKTFDILIVDDDLEVADNFKQILELRGHRVTVVDDGLRCITHCLDSEKHYDIVFMDYHMEGLDGARVTEIVKYDSNKNKTLIFAYTGDNSIKAIDDFKQVGMDGAIIKPVSIKNLELLLDKLELSLVLDTEVVKSIDKKTARSIMIFN